MFTITSSLRIRFWSKVAIQSKTDVCWPWTRGGRGMGYGCIRVEKKQIDSHRMAYILTHGEIPEGMLVLHTCDNRLCCNPDHLQLGTYRDNTVDAVQKGRVFVGHLPRKDPLTDAEMLTLWDEFTRGISVRQLSKKWKVPVTSMAKVLSRAEQLTTA